MDRTARPAVGMTFHGFTPLDEAILRRRLPEVDDEEHACVVVRARASRLNAVLALREEHPGARVVVLDSGVGSAATQVARQAKASALPRTASLRQLVFAVAGGAPPTPILGSEETSSASTSGPLGGLSPREIDVLRLLRSSASNDQIGAQLGISRHTVRGHVQRVLAKLGVHNRVAAAQVAREAGLPAWPEAVA